MQSGNATDELRSKVMIEGRANSFKSEVREWIAREDLEQEILVAPDTDVVRMELMVPAHLLNRVINELKVWNEVELAYVPLSGSDLPGRIIRGNAYRTHAELVDEGAAHSVCLGAFPKALRKRK